MIQRDLINYNWSFNEADKTLTLTDKESNEHFVLDKVRMFSLFRFLIRASESMIVRRRKNKEGIKGIQEKPTKEVKK